MKCPSKKDARKMLINKIKRLREESEALTTDAVFDWADSDGECSSGEPSCAGSKPHSERAPQEAPADEDSVLSLEPL